MSDENIEKIRHSLAHILAHAIKDLYPDAKIGTGPAVDDGFYYDFDNLSIGEADLPKVEKKMKEIIEKNISFEQKLISKKEAEEIFKEEPYKLELINDIEDEKVSVYTSGNFTDLCSGPHVKNSKEIDKNSFTLDRTAGAYFKGSEENKMLKRVYGVAFGSKEELENYLKHREEMKKRDHRKLGADLDLFCFSKIVGAGFPLFTPRGTVVIDELKKKVEEICENYGFQKVLTPHLAKIDLYELSGHAKKFS